MFLQRAWCYIPQRAMASKASKPPPATTTTNSTATTKHEDSSVAKKDDLHDDDDSADTSGQTRINYNKESVGFKAKKHTRDTFLNPLLTPPPRSPRSPEDFRYPERIGHWKPLGFDYTDPVRDKFIFHEWLLAFFSGGCVIVMIWNYMPDYKSKDWAKREAFLRTAKREALGLPLIDCNVVDPDRVVLPTEEELAILDCEIIM